jgi:hypothetical protein
MRWCYGGRDPDLGQALGQSGPRAPRLVGHEHHPDSVAAHRSDRLSRAGDWVAAAPDNAVEVDDQPS